MTFAWPMLLWLLVLPLALLVWELTRRRRVAANTHPKILHAEASVRALKLTPFTASAEGASRRRSPPRVWLCVGLALAVVAIARPQWGRIDEPVFDQSREILLAIDLSRSMLAEDVRPSRLARAKLLIQSLLEKLAGERVGLVVFSGTSFLQSPLSADYEILREFLPSLNPDFLPEGGSNYGALLTTSLQAFTSSASADRFVIILSDGEATDEEWRSKIEPLKAKGIRVLGLGVGTAGGAMIPDSTGGFVKDDRGAVVLSKLESGTLQELARATGGVYRDASGWVDIAALVKETIDAGRKGQFIEKNTIRLVERFQWPLAFALWCLLISFYYEFPVRPRVRDLKQAGNRIPETGKLTATTTAAALLLVVSGFCFPASGFAAAALDPRNKAAQSAKAPPTSVTVAPNAGGDAEAAPAELTVLSKIVGRLAAAETRTARDWAEFAGETVSWGKRVQAAKMTVPEGPVRDALGAVTLGSRLDAKTADWPKLREELEALLQKPDEEKQDQQQQDKSQQPDQKDQQDQQKQEQDPSKQDQKSQGKPEDQKDNAEKNPSPSEQQQPETPKDPGESAFGDMKEKAEPPPPPPQGDTQKVGGEQKEKPSEPIDPSLALPLQKLEQIRNQDSPAQLFQLMEGDRKQQKKSGKDW